MLFLTFFQKLCRNDTELFLKIPYEILKTAESYVISRFINPVSAVQQPFGVVTTK